MLSQIYLRIGSIKSGKPIHRGEFFHFYGGYLKPHVYHITDKFLSKTCLLLKKYLLVLHKQIVETILIAENIGSLNARHYIGVSGILRKGLLGKSNQELL